MRLLAPNKITSEDAAMTIQFQSRRNRRGTSEFSRSAKEAWAVVA
jgi:hypothetical protein